MIKHSDWKQLTKESVSFGAHGSQGLGSMTILAGRMAVGRQEWCWSWECVYVVCTWGECVYEVSVYMGWVCICCESVYAVSVYMGCMCMRRPDIGVRGLPWWLSILFFKVGSLTELQFADWLHWLAIRLQVWWLCLVVNLTTSGVN